MNNNVDRKNNENGAIVIEATISLTTFVFVIFTILSVVNICYIQARVNFALNAAAKEISQYTYLYYALGADEVQAGWYEATSEDRDLASKTITDVTKFVNTLGEVGDAGKTGNFEAMYAGIQQAEQDGKDVKDVVDQYYDKIKENPKEFLIGMAKLAGTEIAEMAKVYLAQALAEMFMSNNLTANSGDTMEAFLARNNVVEGDDGRLLDFTGSSMMAYGMTDKIQLVCTYDVELIKLLNIDFTFKIRQCTQTASWGNGVSMIQDSNVSLEVPKDPDLPDHLQPDKPNLWEMDSPTERGKYIVAYEKKNYVYTKEGTGHGFDAYDDKTNTFVGIISINPYEKTYQKTSAIKSRMSQSYKTMKKGVSALDEYVIVNKRNADETQDIVSVKSDVNTRKYKLIVVFPVGYDTEAAKALAESIESENKDVTVEIKCEYGAPKTTQSAEQ